MARVDRVEAATRREGAAFGAWVTSDVPLPLAEGAGVPRGAALRVRDGRPRRCSPGDLQLADLGVVAGIQGQVSPERGTVWLQSRAAAPGLFWGAILGLALPHLLHARGGHVVHASCVAAGGSAVAFLGAPRAGKSSVAAALIRRGWRLVADDALPVIARGDRVLAQPAFPSIRLFDETADWFTRGDRSRTVPIHPLLPRAWVLVDEARQWQGPEAVPLRCLCLLDRSAKATTRLRGRAAVLAVLGASYHPPPGAEPAAPMDLDAVRRLATTIPVLRLALPRDLPGGPALADAVTAALASRAAS
jgi:hypothetical protein